MKPCIVVPVYGRHQEFVAYNEDGRLIIRFQHYLNVVKYVLGQGYVQVPLNSRIGKTIMDKVEGQHI